MAERSQAMYVIFNTNLHFGIFLIKVEQMIFG